MQIKEAVLAALKELVLPELAAMRQKLGVLETNLRLTNQRLDSTNQRLDDINAHLIDQSRGIDETNNRLNALREELTGRLESARGELTGSLDDTHKRLDNLFGVVVRREEYFQVEARLRLLEQEVGELKRRLAA